MRLIGWDTETFLMAPGVAAPKLVCVSYYDGDTSGVVLRPEGMSLFRSWLVDPNVTLVAHHAPFDLGVVCATDPSLLKPVFDAIHTGRIRCTKVRDTILKNAEGELKFTFDAKLNKLKKTSFSLAGLALRYFDETVDKGGDTWRLRYGRLDGISVEDWPAAAVEYALKDAALCRRIYLHQETIVQDVGLSGIPGEVSQTLTAFCFNLMKIWGVRTDEKSTHKLKVKLAAEYASAVEIAEKAGLVKRGKRDLKAIRDRVRTVYKSHNTEPPLTKKNNVSTSRETLTMKLHPHWPKDEGLSAIMRLVQKQKLLKTYIPQMETGSRVPLTPDWITMVETYRSACARPNLQNLPRGGAVRECFVPRPGYVFVFCDYSTLEMRTLAQVCLDFFKVSVMAQSINEGRDLHLDMASALLERPYDEVVKLFEHGDKSAEEARQFSKIVNFGAPGGMGAKSLVAYARNYAKEGDPEMPLSKAEDLIKKFCTRWSEMPEYFAKCSTACGTSGECDDVTYQRTGLPRGKVGYTALCNHYFQHLAAVGSKDALCQVVEECYTDPYSPFWNCRPVIFAHDEIGMEVPYDDAQRASDAAARLESVMVDTMSRWCPDVDIAASAVMMRRWYKGAKPVHVDGILVPSRPEKQGERTVWVPDLDAKERAA